MRDEKQHEKTKKRYNVVLTMEEGKIFESILDDFDCTATGFIKKICRNEISISEMANNLKK